MYRICLTGHRPKDLQQFMPDGANAYDLHNSFWLAVINRLYGVITAELQLHPEGLELHSGMALGGDMAWAGAIVVARQRFGADKIRFVADVPLMTQANHWRKSTKIAWQHLLDLADEVKVTSDGPYTPAVMEARNQQMINDSDLCLALWTGEIRPHSGTCNGVRDALNAGVDLYRLDPATLLWEHIDACPALTN